jgi:hypothetical protein
MSSRPPSPSDTIDVGREGYTPTVVGSWSCAKDALSAFLDGGVLLRTHAVYCAATHPHPPSHVPATPTAGGLTVERMGVGGRC